MVSRIQRSLVRAQVIRITYDHDGIRISTTVNGTDVTRYVVDKNLPYAQVLADQWTRGSLNGVTRYTYGDALLSQSTSGISQYYLYDGLGSVRGLTDHAGTLIDAYTYDAYGNWLDKTGRTSNVYGYRGEQYDEALDAYYLRARYYQPETGRFLTTDPFEGFITDPLTRHRYIYGSCNPVNNLDPSGKLSMTETLAVTGIMNVLAGISISSFDIGQEFYAGLGKDFFSDAYVFGISGFISPRFLRYITDLIPPLKLPGGGDVLSQSIDGLVGVSLEALVSISSGQVASYAVPATVGGVSGYSRHYSNYKKDNAVGYVVYQGYVWNLWNAEDYKENFAGATLPIGSGMAVFGDWTRAGLGGPYGIARSLLGKTSDFRKRSLYIDGGLSYYYLLAKANYPSEWYVGAMAVALSLIGDTDTCIG